MVTHFASIAEATVYMMDLGFRSTHTKVEPPMTKIMEDDQGRLVFIKHNALLDVEIVPHS